MLLACGVRQRPSIRQALERVTGVVLIGRQGQDFEHSSRPPGRCTGGGGPSVASLPSSLTVMAESFGGPLWARPVGSGEPVDPTAPDLPTALVTALRRWNAVYR